METRPMLPVRAIRARTHVYAHVSYARTHYVCVRMYVLRPEVAQDSEERPPWDGSLNATMLSRVWVERAGSESAVFGGARSLSDLVDMPIDTVYMSMDMPCHATLCYACGAAPPLSLFSPLSSVSSSRYPSLSFFLLFTTFLCPRT